MGVCTLNRSAAGNDAVEAKLAAQLWGFFDPVKGGFGGAVKNQEHCLVATMVDGVIAPLARGNLATIKGENSNELTPVEGNRRVEGREGGPDVSASGCGARLPQPERNYGL
jgi:hypothetical protein